MFFATKRFILITGVSFLREEYGGKSNKDVVTMYSKEWRVRESIVRVREKDKDVQALLESVGFHILEEGQDGDLEEPDCEGPLLIMGRH